MILTSGDFVSDSEDIVSILTHYGKQYIIVEIKTWKGSLVIMFLGDMQWKHGENERNYHDKPATLDMVTFGVNNTLKGSTLQVSTHICAI